MDFDEAAFEKFHSGRVGFLRSAQLPRKRLPQDDCEVGVGGVSDAEHLENRGFRRRRRLLQPSSKDFAIFYEHGE